MQDTRIDKIKKIISKIPYNPGIYLMKDIDGNVIYVGKAKSLKKRVRQYFNKTPKTLRIQKMTEKVENIEYIVTANELEALVLECNYIKSHSPKYNVMLKDDKSYPYIKITVKDEFPGIYITRNLKDDGAKYFGPYTDVGGVRDIINTIKEIFPVKRCKYNLNKKSNKSVGPCLYYHIGRCLGPCLNEVTREEYLQMINEIILFLDGKTSQITSYIDEQIERCIEKLEFEKAASLKQRKDKITSVFAKQTVSGLNEANTDIWGYVVLEGVAYIQVFKLRQGKVSFHDSLEVQDVTSEEFKENIFSLIPTYYLSSQDIPAKLYLKDGTTENISILQEYLSNLKGKKVEVVSPKKGDKLKLIHMIENNININHEEKKKNVLEDLKEFLGLDYDITTVEVYDISNLRDEYIVGAYITYEERRLNKSKYRKFKIKSTETQNDVLSMKEVILRRLKHIEDWGEPDLICIDGGYPQVNAVKEVLEEQNITIPVIGLVKDDRHRTRGIIDLNGNEMDLRRDMEHKRIFNFLTYLQDEVHRFVITYHRSLRDKVAKKPKRIPKEPQK